MEYSIKPKTANGNFDKTNNDLLRTIIQAPTFIKDLIYIICQWFIYRYVWQTLWASREIINDEAKMFDDEIEEMKKI